MGLTIEGTALDMGDEDGRKGLGAGVDEGALGMKGGGPVGRF